MSDLRQAAQQALEYLDAPPAKLWPAGTHERIIAALRAALAQQAEPVEPVAWVRLEAWKSGQSWPDDCFTALPAEGLTPLYTAPPQRKPLSEGEIIDAVRDADLDWAKGWTLDEMQGNRFATLVRAVERAHGIGEEK